MVLSQQAQQFNHLIAIIERKFGFHRIPYFIDRLGLIFASDVIEDPASKHMTRERLVVGIEDVAIVVDFQSLAKMVHLPVVFVVNQVPQDGLVDRRFDNGPILFCQATNDSFDIEWNTVGLRCDLVGDRR